MPIFYLRRLTGRQRTDAANRQIGRYLVFVAGAANAGGFLMVRQYTSHISGIVSAMADNFALGRLSLALAGLAAVASFLVGAASTAIMIRWAKDRELESEYALPLLVEASMLILFGCAGHVFAGRRLLGPISLLCFTMGLQNAILTRVSGTVIRTTHLTGMVTDVSIKLGRMLYAAVHRRPLSSEVEMRKLTLLSSLIGLFFIGGVAGAIGFKHVGFLFSLPLSALLLLIGFVPLVDDLRRVGHL